MTQGPVPAVLPGEASGSCHLPWDLVGPVRLSWLSSLTGYSPMELSPLDSVAGGHLGSWETVALCTHPEPSRTDRSGRQWKGWAEAAAAQ